MLTRKFLMAGGLSAILVLGACGEENTDMDTDTEPVEQEDRGEDIVEEEGEDDTSTD